MKKRFRGFYVLALLFGCIFLIGGCFDSKNSLLLAEELTAIVEQTEAGDSLQIVQNLTMTRAGNSETITMSMTRVNGDMGMEAGFVMRGGGVRAAVYYYDGAVCMVENDYVTNVEDGSFEDMELESGAAFDFAGIINGSNNNRVTKTSIEGGGEEYTVTLGKAGLAKMLGLEELASYLPSKIKMKFIVGSSGYLESYNFSFKMKIDKSLSVTASVEATIKTGLTFNSTVPDYVKQNIYYFKNGSHKPEPTLPETNQPGPNPQPVPDEKPAPEPVPKSESYADTSDGAVKYYNLGNYKAVKYDETYGKVIVARSSTVDIYNASTMEKQDTFEYLLNVECLDTDMGILAVGFGSANQFKLYNLSDNSLISTEATSSPVYQLVMDGEKIMYCGSNQRCTIVFYDYLSKNTYATSSAYAPLLAVNREDHRFYACDTRLSSSNLMYFNSQTGRLIYESPFGQFYNNNGDIYFDGQFVHYFGRSFERFAGVEASASGLVNYYNTLQNFAPYRTLLSSETVDIVSGTTAGAAELAVYDNAEGKYIYKFPFYADRITSLSGNRYFFSGKGNKYIALTDLSYIAGDIEGNVYEARPENTVAVSEDGNVLSLRQGLAYTDSVSDGSFIYLLDRSGYRLEVYDAVTFEAVKSFKFLLKPECFDAYGGRLAIGFGEANQFFLYSTLDWTYQIVPTPEQVYSLVIYKDSVIHAPVDQHCSIYRYNFLSKTNSKLSLMRSMYYVRMDIDRNTGMLYMCDRYSSSSDIVYYNLETNRVAFTSSDFYSNSKSIFFDGAYVHYFGKTFDAQSGAMISESGMARLYKNVSDFSGIMTVYDDGKISAFSALAGGEICTVFYDLETNKVLYILDVYTTKIIRDGESYIILGENSDMIYRVTL